jgi:hypothetical protein
VNRPNNTDKCGFCGCTFGKHFETYDGSQTGCITDHGQREGRCTCKGYAVVQRWSQTPAVTGDYWDNR